jgi:hypothetical protein
MKNIDNLMRKILLREKYLVISMEGFLHKKKIYYFIINLMYFIMFLREFKK